MLSYLSPSLWVKKKTQSLPRWKAAQNCSSAIVQKCTVQHCSPEKQDFENPLIHEQLQVRNTAYGVRVLLTLRSSWTASNNTRQGLQSSFFSHWCNGVVQWQQDEDEETPASQQEVLKWLVWRFLGWMPGKTEAPFSSHFQQRLPSAQDGYTSESLGEAWLTCATKTQACRDTPACAPQAANKEGKRTNFSCSRSRGKVQKGWFSFLPFFFFKALGFLFHL